MSKVYTHSLCFYPQKIRTITQAVKQKNVKKKICRVSVINIIILCIKLQHFSTDIAAT